MIDIHSHILPGIDDGAATLEHSIALARAAVADGITDLVATPHHYDGKYSNSPDLVVSLTDMLNERLQELAIPLKVHTGQEIHIHNELLLNWQRKELLPMANSSYALLEMPSSYIPKSMEELIYELNLMGVRPVIAHPERNAAVVQNPDRLAELIELGAYAQVTSHSLIGGFGRGIERASWTLCRSGLIHFVASDAHNLEWRSFRMKEAYDRVNAVLGPNWASYYEHNAQSLLNNTEIIAAPPAAVQIKGTSSWSRLKSLFSRS